jgi:hypothetical protein
LSVQAAEIDRPLSVWRTVSPKRRFPAKED